MSKNISIFAEKKTQLPSVYTIILNYNNYFDTVETIESVLSLDYVPNTVLLVENSQIKQLYEKFEPDFRTLQLLKIRKIWGMPEEIMLVFKKLWQSGADYIFLLNNDVKLEKDVLKKCVSAMEKSPDCGACQPVIVTSENVEMVWSAGTVLFFGYPRLFLKERNSRKMG